MRFLKVLSFIFGAFFLTLGLSGVGRNVLLIVRHVSGAPTGFEHQRIDPATIVATDRVTISHGYPQISKSVSVMRRGDTRIAIVGSLDSSDLYLKRDQSLDHLLSTHFRDRVQAFRSVGNPVSYGVRQITGLVVIVALALFILFCGSQIRPTQHHENMVA